MNPFGLYETPSLALEQPVRVIALDRTGKVCGYCCWVVPVILYGVEADDLTAPFNDWYSLSDLEKICQ